MIPDAANARVPHKIHQIWVGGAPMPEEFRVWGEKWAALNPGFVRKLWTDRDVELMTLRCKLEYDMADSPAMKADILRYEILYAEGGVYIDCDVEPLKPIHTIITPNLRGFVCLEDHRGPWFGNAVLGACVGHPFFDKLLNELPDNVTRTWHRPPNERTGPVFLTNNWRQGDTTVFPRTWFYPYSHTEKERRGEKFHGSFGVHHWMGSWLTEGAQ